MERRDIFNIFFKGISIDTSTIEDAEPVLNLSDYYKRDYTLPVYQEWTPISNQSHFKLDLSNAYAFSLTLELDYAYEKATVLKLGLKKELQHKGIAIGINHFGCLFIGQLTDERVLPKEKLIDGVQLVLNVYPLKNGMSHAKLRAIDRSGLTISLIKSTVIKTTDWAGNMELSTLKYNFLRIEGCKSI